MIDYTKKRAELIEAQKGELDKLDRERVVYESLIGPNPDTNLDNTVFHKQLTIFNSGTLDSAWLSYGIGFRDESPRTFHMQQALAVARQFKPLALEFYDDGWNKRYKPRHLVEALPDDKVKSQNHISSFWLEFDHNASDGYAVTLHWYTHCEALDAPVRVSYKFYQHHFHKGANSFLANYTPKRPRPNSERITATDFMLFMHNVFKGTTAVASHFKTIKYARGSDKYAHTITTLYQDNDEYMTTPLDFLLDLASKMGLEDVGLENRQVV